MSWEEANAFVDGELTPEQSEALRLRAEQDPVLRAKIATLRRLRSAAMESATLQPGEIGPHVFGFRLSVGLAGCAMLVFLSLLIAAAVGPTAEPRTAVTVFEDWFARSADGPPIPAKPIAVTSWAGAPPDLGAAHLELVFMASPGDPSGGVVLGYRGRHGCRVGLFIGPADGTDDETFEGRDPRLQIRRWSHGGTAFALFGRGMNEARFAALAGVVQGLTREHDPERMRVALGQVSRIGHPCTS
jgi:anti-sigma factor RsiW